MAVRASPEQKAVAVALSSGSARVWTLPDWEERVVYRDDAHGVTAVAFSPDGATLATGSLDANLRLFDVGAALSGEARRELVRQPTGVTALACALTALWFPARYWDLVREFDPLASWLVLARGLTLVALLALLTVTATEREPARSRSPAPSPGRT